VQWYNEVHHRSALKFVTPAQRHRGEDADILARPQALRCRPRSPPRALERADPRLAPARCRPAQPGTCRENRDRRHANGSLIFATSSLTATEIKDAPRVRLEDKLEVERLGSGFFAAVLRLGYMERPRFDTILDLLSQTAYPPSAEHPSLFLSRARIGTANVRAAIRWRARLYAFMQRNTPSPDFLLDAPSEQLIEIGVHYEL